MSLDNSIKITDLMAPIRVNTWERTPGLAILQQSNDSGWAPPMANRVFTLFVDKKIPETKALINKLAFKHTFKDLHLPSSLKTVFFVHIDELIEHYQNQIDQRDQQIDQDYIKLKQQLSKNISQFWPEDNHEINDFLNLLKTKLCLVDAVPANFDETISQWAKVLKIQYVANMSVLAIYLDKGYIKAHRLPTAGLSSHAVISTLIPDSDKFRAFNIPYSESIQAFYLILRQVSKDLCWVIPKMFEKLPPMDDKKLEADLFQVTNSLAQNKSNLSVYASLQRYEKEINDLVCQLYLLNIQQNETIEKLALKTTKVSVIVCDASKDFEATLIKLKQNRQGRYTAAGIDLHGGHPLIPYLSNYSDCVQLKNNYLDVPMQDLVGIMNGIFAVNVRWSEFQRSGTMPASAYSQILQDGNNQKTIPDSSSFSVFQPVTEEESKQYSDKFVAELEAEDSRNICSRKNKNTKTLKHPGQVGNNSKSRSRSPANSLNKTSTTTTTTTTAATTTTTTTTNTTTTATTTNTTILTHTASSRIELLRAKLTNLFHQNHSSSLRQAIWHLDHLTVIQDTLAKSATTRLEHLCLLSAVSNFAHKTLEQTYRYSLKQQQPSFTTTHNLKYYHRQMDPNCTTFPSIVDDIFLANHWHRHFYTQHEKWSSHTTLQVEIPHILDKLFKIAENQPYSLEDLNHMVEEIIKNTCEQTAALLKLADGLDNSPKKQFEELQLQKAISEKTFTQVYQTLENFLTNFNVSHPLYFNVKQSLVALKMLEVGIEQMNKAQNFRQLSTWTTWNLLQMQESIENVFHCIEYCQKGQIGIQHELSTLAENLNIDMGSLGDHTQQLSYKVRYPSEVKNDSLSSDIINDLEALKEAPELAAGYKLISLSNMFWAPPTFDASPHKIAGKMSQLFSDTERFLREKAIPALQKAYKQDLSS